MVLHRSPQHKCTACQKMFHFKSSLKRHMHVHTHDPTHLCQICGKTFGSKFNLQRHEMVHSDEKQFTCSKCKFKCASKDEFQTHLLLQHNGEKPFKSQECGKAYLQKSYLKRHACKTPVTKHQCDICKKEFAKARYLSQHVRKLHKDPSFQCDTCGRQFRWKANMQKHLKTCKL